MFLLLCTLVWSYFHDYIISVYIFYLSVLILLGLRCISDFFNYIIIYCVAVCCYWLVTTYAMCIILLYSHNK